MGRVDEDNNLMLFPLLVFRFACLLAPFKSQRAFICRMTSRLKVKVRIERVAIYVIL